MNHLETAIVLGNQKCIGAKPAFSINLVINIIDLVKGREEEVRVAVRSKAEPLAWAIKYFAAASFRFCIFECSRKGIKEYKLISSPIQMINHEWLESLRNIPKIIKKIKNG